MLDEPGCVMEPTDGAYSDAGVMVAFGACGPLVVEEFDEYERRPPAESGGEKAGQRMFGGWRFWGRG